VYDVELNW